MSGKYAITIKKGEGRVLEIIDELNVNPQEILEGITKQVIEK